MIPDLTRFSDQRIAALDGFRGLAILMVTLYRFGEVSLTESLIGRLLSRAILVGAGGVDLFFVLSGFLITGILVDAKQDKNYFSRFYFRRTLRIFPLYFFSLFLFLLLLPWLGINSIVTGESIVGTDQIRGNPWHLWLYTTNLSIAWHNDWHFGALNHYWSLAIEEQFYLIWPVIVLVISPQRLLKWCLIVWGVSIGFRIGFSYLENAEVASKTFTLFRMDGLLLGSAAALMIRHVTNLEKWKRCFRGGILVSLILYAATLLMGSQDFTIRFTAVSLVGVFVLLTVVSDPNNGLVRRIFETRALCSLGKYSYAMYIFQWPLIPLMAPIVSPASLETWLRHSLVAALVYVLIMFGFTYLMAMASWFLLESKILSLRKLAFPRGSDPLSGKA